MPSHKCMHGGNPVTFLVLNHKVSSFCFFPPPRTGSGPREQPSYSEASPNTSYLPFKSSFLNLKSILTHMQNPNADHTILRTSLQCVPTLLGTESKVMPDVALPAHLSSLAHTPSLLCSLGFSHRCLPNARSTPDSPTLGLVLMQFSLPEMLS